MKKTLYGIGVLIFGIIMFGTVGALEMSTLTLSDAFWQLIASIAGIIFFWHLLASEDSKETKKRRRK